DLDQRIFMLLIRNPYFEKAIGHERNADHRNKQPGIFQEEATADFMPSRDVSLRRGGVIRHSVAPPAAPAAASTCCAGATGAKPLRILRNSRCRMRAPPGSG